MATQPTPDVFGQAIPVRRMNEMATRIHQGIRGSEPVAFAGFVWCRPQPPVPHRVVKKVPMTERQVA
jgi:hypothetical protein